MARVYTDDEVASRERKPARRVYTDTEVEARAVPGPSSGDPVPPPVAAAPAADDVANPSWLASAIQGLGEGFGVGSAGRRITAAAQTVLPNALGGTDGTYTQNLAAQEARTRGAATGASAAFYAPAKIAGGVAAALTLRPSAFAALAGGNTLAEGGSVGDAAQTAALSYGLGKIGARGGSANNPASWIPSLPSSGIMRLAPVAVGGYGAARTAMDPNVPTGDRIAAAGEGALATLLPGLAKMKAKKAAGLEAPRRAALADTEAAAREGLQSDAMKQAAQEQAAIKDVEKQNAATDKQNVSRTGAADAASTQEARANVADARLTAAERGDQRAATYDQQAATYRNAVDALRTKRKAENDAHRLAALDHADEMASARTDYDTARAVWDDHVARQADIADKAAASAQRARALRDEHAKLTAAHMKEQERIAAQVKDLEDLGAEGADGVDASIAGKIGEMFRETHTRLDNLIRGSATHGLPVNPEYVDLHKYLTATLNKNTPRKVADLIEFRRDPKAWIEKQRDAAARGDGFTPAGTPQQDLPAAAPTLTDAQKSLDAKDAAKAYVHPDDQGAVDAASKAKADLDALRANPPAAPNDDAHQQAVRDFLRKKLEAGPERLPPKPDAIAKRGADRADKTALRDYTEKQGKAALHESPGRTDRALLLDKREPIKPNAEPGETVQARVIRRLMEGRANVESGLEAARVTTPGLAKTVAEQLIREQRGPSSGRLGAFLGGAAGTAISPGVGTAVGAHLGHKLTAKAPESVVSKYLARGIQPEVQNGVTVNPERYSSPAEAHGALEATQEHHDLAALKRRVFARAAAQAAQERAKKRGAP